MHIKHLLMTTSLGLAVVSACQTDSGQSINPDHLDSKAVKVSCPDSPAEEVFEAAVCLCDGFSQVGDLLVGSNTGDSVQVGVNGTIDFVNQAEIRGDLIAFAGYHTNTESLISGSLITAANATMVGSVTVGADLEVGGDLSAVGEFSVGGTLRVAGETSVVGMDDVANVGVYGNTPPLPCDCDPSTFFDVGAAVAAAAISNDNAAIGIGTSLSEVGTSRLDLGSGTYYFDEFQTVGDTQVLIDGAVALHIDGDLAAVGSETFLLTDGSTLDLYVSGGVKTVGNIAFGDPNDPSAFRLYVGGTDSVVVSVGETAFNGAIYAPQATLAYVGDTVIRGAVFANQLDGVGSLTLGYASPEESGDDCPEPGEDDGPDAPDGPVIID